MTTEIAGARGATLGWHRLLPIIGAVLLILVMISVGTALWVQRASVEETATATVATIALEITESAAAQIMIGEAATLHAAFKIDGAAGADGATRPTRMDSLATFVAGLPGVIGLSAFDEAGKPIASAGAIIPERDWTSRQIRRHRDEWLVSDVMPLSLEQRTVGISRGVWSADGRFMGMAVAVISLQRLVEDFGLALGTARTRTTLLINGDVVLLDRVGSLARPDDLPEPAWHDPRQLSVRALSDRDVTSFSVAEMAAPMAYAVTQARDLPLRAVVQLPMAPARDQWRLLSLAAFSGIATLSVLLGGFLIALRLAERRRARAMRDLGAANQTLARFAEISAHHLQEPARRIVSYVGLLNRNLDPDNVRTAEIAATLEAQARRQQTLIRDIQLYVAAGSAKRTPSTLDTTAVARDVADGARHRAIASDITITVEPLPPLPISRPWLKRCLVEVLKNAIEHADGETPPRIALWAEQATDCTRLMIADNGPGIPAQYQERVFGVFERLSSRDTDGHTGVGLAIVKRIMSTIGGRARLQDTKGGGTTVVLEFPVASD